jgi:hypothetical protein
MDLKQGDKTHLRRRHDLLHVLGVELQHAVEDANLVVTQRLLARAVELEEGLEFRLCISCNNTRNS